MENNIVFESHKKYEEKLKYIFNALESSDKKKIEEEIMEFEKLIDEESVNRILATHQLNNKLIGKLKENKYDFNDDKTVNSTENIRNNAVIYLNQLN